MRQWTTEGPCLRPDPPLASAMQGSKVTQSESQPASLRELGWALLSQAPVLKQRRSDHPLSGHGKDDLAEIQSDSGISVGSLSRG